jgi:hypothetical protein
MAFARQVLGLGDDATEAGIGRAFRRRASRVDPEAETPDAAAVLRQRARAKGAPPPADDEPTRRRRARWNRVRQEG